VLSDPCKEVGVKTPLMCSDSFPLSFWPKCSLFLSFTRVFPHPCDFTPSHEAYDNSPYSQNESCHFERLSRRHPDTRARHVLQFSVPVTGGRPKFMQSNMLVSNGFIRRYKAACHDFTNFCMHLHIILFFLSFLHSIMFIKMEPVLHSTVSNEI